MSKNYVAYGISLSCEAYIFCTAPENHSSVISRGPTKLRQPRAYAFCIELPTSPNFFFYYKYSSCSFSIPTYHPVLQEVSHRRWLLLLVYLEKKHLKKIKKLLIIVSDSLEKRECVEYKNPPPVGIPKKLVCHCSGSLKWGMRNIYKWKKKKNDDIPLLTFFKLLLETIWSIQRVTPTLILHHMPSVLFQLLLILQLFFYIYIYMYTYI